MKIYICREKNKIFYMTVKPKVTVYYFPTYYTSWYQDMPLCHDEQYNISEEKCIELIGYIPEIGCEPIETDVNITI